MLLTFGLYDVFVVTVIARNRINGVGSLFFRDRILRFGEKMPQSLKRLLSNFNVVAILLMGKWERFYQHCEFATQQAQGKRENMQPDELCR